MLLIGKIEPEKEEVNIEVELAKGNSMDRNFKKYGGFIRIILALDHGTSYFRGRTALGISIKGHDILTALGLDEPSACVSCCKSKERKSLVETNKIY